MVAVIGPATTQILHWEHPLAIDNGRNAEARRHLVERIRGRRSLAVTGAGVAAWAGYGTWWEVLHHLADAVEQHSRGAIPDAEVIIRNNPDPLHCARQLGIHLGPRLQAFITNEFGPKASQPNDVLFQIVNLPFLHFLTFNFDPSHERVHESLGTPCRTLSTSRESDLLDLLRNMETEGYGRRVLHLHGFYNDPIDLIALTNPGYTRLYRNTFFRNVLWTLLISRQMVFLGFGFNDRDFTNALREVARDLTEDHDLFHSAIIPIWPEEDDLPRRNTFNDDYKIDPVFYEIRGDHDHPGSRWLR